MNLTIDTCCMWKTNYKVSRNSIDVKSMSQSTIENIH